MPKWAEKDTAKETGAGGKQVSRAFHDARNDAAKEGGWGVPKDRGGGGDDCFIATAAYGSPLDVRVQCLRNFRDRILCTKRWGRCLIVAYYRISPPIARLVKKSDFFKGLVRSALTRLVRWIKF